MSRFVHNTFLADDPGLAPLAGRGESQVNLPGILVRRRWLFLVGLCVPLAVAAAYLSWTDPVYMASSRLSIQPAAPKIIGEYAPPPAAGGPAYLNAQCELIRSRTIVADALRSLDVGKMRLFSGVSDPVEYCRQNLTVEVGSRDALVTVSLLSPYPQESARIVNTIVNSYVNWQANQRRSSTGEVLKILEREKQSCASEGQQTQQALEEFKQANGVFSFDGEKGNLVLQRLARLSEALTDAQVQIIGAEALQQATRQRAGDFAGLRQLVGLQLNSSILLELERDIVATQAALDEANSRLAALKQKYSTRHPIVQPAEARVGELKQRIAERQDRYVRECVAAAQTRLAEARQRESQLQSAFDEQRKLAAELNLRTAEYARLDADLKRTQRLGESIDNRLREIRIADEAAALNINVLERATGRDNAVRSHEARTIAYGLAAGLLLGCWLAIARDMADKRLRCSAEAVAATELPVIGVAPKSKTAGHSISPEVMDACRTVYASLQFGHGQNLAKTLAVTSPASGDGRTTMAMHVAAAMAWAGKRVLLVDADLRQPSLHQRAGVSDEPGLCDVLRRSMPVEQVLCTINIDGLELLPAGQRRAGESALLQSRAFSDLLHELSRTYDHVVIDCAPVADLADARAVAAVCDATLLVLRAGASTGKQAQGAAEGLRHVGANVVGVAINAAPAKKTSYSGSGWCCEYPPNAAVAKVGPGAMSMPGPTMPSVAA